MDDRSTPSSGGGTELVAIGDRLPRREDDRLLRGTGRFIEDLQLSDEARVAFLRSRHAHARIDNINISAATSAAGVVAVFIGADATADGSADVAAPQPLCRPSCTTPARSSRWWLPRARPCAKRCADPLPAHATCAAAAGSINAPLWPQSPDNLSFVVRLGDAVATARAFAAADHIETLDCESNRMFGGAIECRSYIGDYDAAGERMILIGPVGKPHTIRKTLAGQVFGVRLDQVVVKVPDIGGGFGMKNVLYPEACLVMWAARRLGRPIKWIGRRDEAFLSDVGCREQTNHGEMAFDREGRILAVRVRSLGNLGAYLAPRGVVSLRNSGFVVSNGYAVPHIDFEMRALYTNTAPTCNFRGAGEPEGINITERLVDAGARALGLDPVEIRRRNLVPADGLPRDNPAGLRQDTGDYPAMLDAALEMADRDGFAARRAETQAAGRLRGWGTAMHLFMGAFNYSEATELVVFEDGTIDLLIGSQSSGQGHETVFAQLAAAQLGIAPSRVRVIQGDTDRIASGSGTGASRSLTIGGSSTVLTADALIAAGLELAAHLLEAAAEDIGYRNGVFEVAGTDRRLDLGAIAQRVAETELPADLGPGFSASASYQPQYGTSACGSQFCEVEVDPDTGAVTLERFGLVQDVGRAVNPIVVEGQIHGGIATGIGQALCEHAIYDADNVQLVTGSFMDYALPRADNVPAFDLELAEIPSIHNPLGAKGIGEAGGLGTAPAIINAILDALAPLGVRHLEMPVTSERVWQAIGAARS